MPRRPGRPPANLEQNILREMSDDGKRLEAMLPKSLGSSAWRMAYEVACLRLILEKGTRSKKLLVPRRLENLGERSGHGLTIQAEDYPITNFWTA